MKGHHSTFSRVLIAMLFAATAVAAGMGKDHESSVSPDEALSMLKKGHERFESGNRDYPRQGADRREETSSSQKPFAAILSCSDSRVPVEHIFDQGIGDVFVVRVAGAVCGASEAASLEYAVEHLGVPLVVVLGHGACGAVTSVFRGDSLKGALTPLQDRIKPAVDRTRSDKKQGATINDAVRQNTFKAIEDLFATSSIVRERAYSGKLKVIGAFYRFDEGSIEWMGPHPDQKKLLAGGGSSGGHGATHWTLRLLGALGALVALVVGVALVLMINKRS